MERIEATDLVADSEEYVVNVTWVRLDEEEKNWEPVSTIYADAPETSGASIEVLQDNQGAKALVENPLSSARSKIIDVRFHFISDLFKTRKINVEYVSVGQAGRRHSHLGSESGQVPVPP